MNSNAMETGGEQEPDQTRPHKNVSPVEDNISFYSIGYLKADVENLKGGVKTLQADLRSLAQKVDNCATKEEVKTLREDLRSLTQKVDNCSTKEEVKTLGEDLRSLSQKVDNCATKEELNALAQKVDNCATKEELNALAQKVDNCATKEEFKNFENKIVETIDLKFQAQDSKIDAQFNKFKYWFISIMFGVVVSLLYQIVN